MSFDSCHLPLSHDLLFDNEVDAPILLETIAVVLETEGTILSVAGRFEVCNKPQVLKICLHMPCPTLSKHEVIRSRTDFVGAAFEQQTCDTFYLENLCIRLQYREHILTE